MISILDKILNVFDIKNFNLDELNFLCFEIRNCILIKVSKVGGYFGFNLGIVELIVVFYYVFNFFKDKFVWDVSY